MQLLLPQEPALGRVISSSGSCHTSGVQYSLSAKELRRENVAQSVGFAIGIVSYWSWGSARLQFYSTEQARNWPDFLIIQNIAHPKMDWPTGPAFQNSCWPSWHKTYWLKFASWPTTKLNSKRHGEEVTVYFHWKDAIIPDNIVEHDFLQRISHDTPAELL